MKDLWNAKKILFYSIECHSEVGSTHALYSGGPRFKSLDHRLVMMRFLVVLRGCSKLN
jgi:hypothetical protein